MNKVVETRSIKKTFKGTGRVLNGVDLQVGESEVVGLLGPNGSGKSTLLKIMVDLLPADEGDVTFFGKHYSRLGSPVNRVGVLLSPEWVDERVTVRDFVISQLILIGEGSSSRKKTATQILRDVGLSSSESKRISNLSLGMRQRVCLACCFASKPDILILDEPLNGLDADGVLWVQELIRSYRDNGGSILLSSHLMAEMQTVADTVAILDGGKIVAKGTIDSLSGDRRTLVSTESNPNDLLEVYRKEGYTDVVLDGEKISIGGIRPAEASRLAFSYGFSVSGLSETKKSLAQIYRSVVGARE
ncbi:ATP-binding cassette domain-containing protein [Corynebacterium variabile]|uniref:ATP-binding cassette domain-containing protein n=1 Tax=Corynebacterium variabile TaxID=1727 RepID=UPI003FCF96D1